MSWGRYDDDLDDDERFWRCRLAAIGLYWAALARCLRRDENFVPEQQVAMLAGRNQEQSPAEDLLAAGLWTTADGGYRYAEDDWHAIRLPDEKREELRQKRAEAGRAGGLRSGQVRRTRSEANGKQVLQANPSKREASASSKPKQTKPVPVPVREQTRSVGIGGVGGRGEQLGDCGQPTPITQDLVMAAFGAMTDDKGEIAQ